MNDSPLPSLTDDAGVALERRDGLAILTLNRPEKRNPITSKMPSRLMALFDRLEADPDCRVIILTGSGPAFCGGADLGGLLGEGDIDPEQQYQSVRRAFRTTQRMRELDLPIIAAVNGVAVGGGAALGLAADIAIAAPEASYYFAFGRIGASGADMGCTHLLPRHVGAMRAAHLLLTGATVTAEEGLELGLFVEIAAADNLLTRAEEIARRIIDAYPRRAAAITKLALARGEHTDMATSVEYEAIAQNYTFRLDEHQERLSAFLSGKK